MAFRLQGVPLDDGASSAVLCLDRSTIPCCKLTKKPEAALPGNSRTMPQMSRRATAACTVAVGLRHFVKSTREALPENKKTHVQPGQG